MSYYIKTSWHFSQELPHFSIFFHKNSWWHKTYCEKTPGKISIWNKKSLWRNLGYKGAKWFCGFFASSQTLWPLLFENFLNNSKGFQHFLVKIYLPHTYHTRKCYVKFQVHIFTQHEEMLGLVTDTLSLKPTISAIICEKNKT